MLSNRPFPRLQIQPVPLALNSFKKSKKNQDRVRLWKNGHDAKINLAFVLPIKSIFQSFYQRKMKTCGKCKKKKKIVKWKQCYQEQKKKKSKFFQNEFADCGIEREHFPRASGSWREIELHVNFLFCSVHKFPSLSSLRLNQFTPPLAPSGNITSTTPPFQKRYKVSFPSRCLHNISKLDFTNSNR